MAQKTHSGIRRRDARECCDDIDRSRRETRLARGRVGLSARSVNRASNRPARVNSRGRGVDRRAGRPFSVPQGPKKRNVIPGYSPARRLRPRERARSRDGTRARFRARGINKAAPYAAPFLCKCGRVYTWYTRRRPDNFAAARSNFSPAAPIPACVNVATFARAPADRVTLSIPVPLYVNVNEIRDAKLRFSSPDRPTMTAVKCTVAKRKWRPLMRTVPARFYVHVVSAVAAVKI